jgi:hypothetical protein
VQRAFIDTVGNNGPNHLMAGDIVYPSICKNKRNFPSHQSQIDEIMHCTLVDWLVEMCNDRGIQSTTLCLSIHIMDEYLRREANVPTHRFQLLGCACLILAAKLEQVAVSIE